MSVVKIIEISAESPKSFEHAIEIGIARASQSLENIRSAWIAEQKVTVEDGRINGYRVVMRVSFELS